MAGSDPRATPEGPDSALPAGTSPHEQRTALRPFDPTELLARLWLQNLPLLRARVEVLDEAATEAVTGVLTPGTRARASDVAHKLAGSLGMFGFPRGTEIAREMEQALEARDEPDAALLLSLTTELRAVLPL